MTVTCNADHRYRILFVDDDPNIQKLVSRILRSHNIDVISVVDESQAVAVARREKPDLILLDYEMPTANGIEVLERFRSDGILRTVPVVFVTGNDSHAILTACFQAGAADYLRKPFCAPELLARIKALLDRRQLQGQLERLALHDALTDLANRTSIRDEIQTVLDCQQGGHYAVLFLDFDRFKLVNDSLGHDVGDQLLRQIADRLRASLRSGDSISHLSETTMVARLGGDEFVVLLKDLTDPNDAVLVANRLLAVLADSYLLAGHQVYCTASIGLVNGKQAYSSPEEVLRDADIAMYEAKAAGKGCCVIFHPEMHNKAAKRLKIENDLRRAIANNELFLVYQPIVSLESGRATGFEALVRWRHPEQGLVMPADFLPIAAESGLIVPMGNWVIRQACQQFADWQRSLGPAAPSNIHVNVARQQLLGGDLVSVVQENLKRYDVAPGCLHLEITENEIMHNPTAAKTVLTELRQSGVKIDMDDFGTGHSSLACLQELPIDVLKIDRSFVANMERSRSFSALVHAVTTLAQNLGLTAVAEGIETADQLAMLQAMDCEFGQGYYFAKPLHVDEVSTYLSPTKSRPSTIPAYQPKNSFTPFALHVN